MTADEAPAGAEARREHERSRFLAGGRLDFRGSVSG
ncbi:hypothetical protein Srot_1221 [Segniliparus rotundus DSM 44985]|uniref:Uncharacterized protein n=1 Tax=Segniliparus rotundus (strain ATCC BAA-972 / CDC 1076 / CIP 108378 / DSM 44985 / JCM 13578) TaxID=640132 RepID=D6ZFG8_SEGRD|nr:hypothetical protein Srot_1221 [Segniliparus rotundus DSM 44985]